MNWLHRIQRCRNLYKFALMSGSSHIWHVSKLEIVVKLYLLLNTLHYCFGKITSVQVIFVVDTIVNTNVSTTNITSTDVIIAKMTCWLFWARIDCFLFGFPVTYFQFEKGACKYYVSKEVGGWGGQMLMFADKVGGWGWLNADISKSYKKNQWSV